MNIHKLPSTNVLMEVNTDASKRPHTAVGPDGRSNSSSGTSVLDQEQSPVDDANHCSTSSICASPICRQFWKAGVYTDNFTPATRSGSSYLHVHPRFLHSNATSHKWVFGAVAELIDNAVDEIQSGATYVIIDKTVNPRNGSSALLIQDDGSGLDPEAMRRCLSFGFSDKKSISSIGKYGNGFKTSSMRLGADVIVFSRNTTNRKLTQSIGLLSYTFLTREGYDKIVVPMVHYDYNFITRTFTPLQSKSDENSNLNLSLLLQWSPYSTEKELLQQFEDVGSHGTKVIVYNLWLDEDGNLELDFESDPEDICITRDAHRKMKDGTRKATSEQHIANRLRYSLRAYLSILYLKLPETFAMALRGKVVLYHNVSRELKYAEVIKYKPHTAATEVVTTIGFIKDAQLVNIHGFNVYHKNRLILPFYPVVSSSNNRGRGVVGVLEANFVEPTHDKQDFEKTSLFQKLVQRLRDMTWEYWDYHCGLIGYQFKKKIKPSSKSNTAAHNFIHHHGFQQPTIMKNYTAVGMTKNRPMVNVKYTKVILEPKSLSKSVQPSIPKGSQKEQLTPVINRPTMTPVCTKVILESNSVSKPAEQSTPGGFQAEQSTHMRKSSSDVDMIKNGPMVTTVHSKVTIDSNSLSQPVEPSTHQGFQAETEQPTPMSKSFSVAETETIKDSPMVTTVNGNVGLESNSMSPPVETNPRGFQEEQPVPMMESSIATGTTIDRPPITPVYSKVTIESNSLSKPVEPSSPKGFESEQPTPMSKSSSDVDMIKNGPMVTTVHSKVTIDSNSLSTPVEPSTPRDLDFQAEQEQPIHLSKSSSDADMIKDTPMVTTVCSNVDLESNSLSTLVKTSPKGSQEGPNLKRKASDQYIILISDDESEDDSNKESNVPDLANHQRAINAREEYKKLKAECLEYEKSNEQLDLKVKELEVALEDAQEEYVRLLGELIEMESEK